MSKLKPSSVEVIVTIGDNRPAAQTLFAYLAALSAQTKALPKKYAVLQQPEAQLKQPVEVDK